MPAEYARILGITTMVCTPLSAAGRAYGVICADRGGGRFELSDGERHLLWTLGKNRCARRHRAQRDSSAGAHAPSGRTAGPRARDPRERPCSACSASRSRSVPKRRSITPSASAAGSRCSGALSDLRKGTRAAAGAPAARNRDDALRPSSSACGAPRGRRFRCNGSRTPPVPRGSRTTGPVRARRGPCATSASTPIRPRSRSLWSRDADTFETRGAQRRRAPGRVGRRNGPAPGRVRGPAARRRRRVRAGRDGQLAGPARRPLTREVTVLTGPALAPRPAAPDRQAPSAGGRRPRCRPLGFPRAARRATLGRAVPRCAERAPRRSSWCGSSSHTSRWSISS